MNPSQSNSTSSSQQLPRTAAQVATDLKYLREQRICEKLEYLVKQLLKQQPEDPVLFVCSQLRERLAASRSTSDESWWLHKDHEGRGVDNSSHDDAVCVDDGASQITTSPSAPHPTAPLPTAAGGTLMTYPPPQTPGGGAAANTPGAHSAGPTGHPFSGSLRTSRVTTPAAARPSTTGRGGLERDESAKSDQSYFSIASVDMQEFLSEFRVARNEFMGTQGDRINRNDLAEIVDRVSIPLPDVKLIADLFDEMVAPSGGAAVTGRPMSSELHHHGVATSSSPQPYIMPNTGGGSSMPPVSPTDDSAGAGFPLRVATSAIDGSDATVPFEAFLARMNYKIQGRYPHDAVRQVYLSLLRTETTTVGASSSLSSQQAHRGSGTEAAGDNTPITAASSGVIASKITLQMEAAQQAANALISSPASGGVPRGRAIAEGLWLGLGIRLSPAELLRLTNLLGIGQGDNALLQLTDFSSLVAAATGQLTKEEQEALAA